MSTFSAAQLQAGGQASDKPLIAIDGSVYDVSSFAMGHPGGEQILLVRFE